LGVLEYAPVVFEHMEAGAYDKLFTLFRNDIWLKYARKDDATDNTLILALFEHSYVFLFFSRNPINFAMILNSLISNFFLF
jgi:hypothetical protein